MRICLRLKTLSATAVATFIAATCISASEPLEMVETRIGTAPSETVTAGMFGRKTEEFGQCLPAVCEPHGMNFWTPQTRDTERKCVAPYYYNDTRLQGFRNSHWIVGGCTQDYGSMTLMPLAGSLRTAPEARASRVDHANERTTPAYYRNILLDEGIEAEMTGRSRAAIFRFTYDADGFGYLVVNPNSDEAQGTVAIDPTGRRIIGSNPVHRIYQGKGEPAGFAGYFVVELDREPVEWGVARADSILAGATQGSNAAGLAAYVKFPVKKGEPVMVRAGSSFTDLAGAEANLRAEIPHWDFDRTRSELTDIWRNQFDRIRVDQKGASQADLTKFYSAMYRASMLPRTFNDVDGRYPAFAKGSPILTMEEGRDYYEDYSMWDTYRALHPLLNIIDRKRSADMMNSLVLKAEQGGWLPIFPCWNSYTAAMIGDHCIAALADAHIKGVGGFDIRRAYRAMRRNAFESPADEADYRNGMGRRALRSYLQYGYIPLEDSVKDAYHQREQVSRTLEYAFDDFCLAQVARSLGIHSDADTLMRRAQNYRNVIHPATGYARGRHADGRWAEKSDPVGFDKTITEGAPCHYTWYVPHDQPGLMKAMGGREAYEARLDSMFTHGRYWHGNEPCHQVAWLFNHTSQPWKTQEYVRHILDTEYLPTPGGLSGNDDAGQMSAWYIFGAMGFYPVCPATTKYAIGAPIFKRVDIAVGDGRTFTIEAEGTSPENKYIQSITLNGKPYHSLWLDHADLMRGGTLRLTMGPRPNYRLGDNSGRHDKKRK